MGLDAIRTFLHLFGVAGWVGGQVLMICNIINNNA